MTVPGELRWRFVLTKLTVFILLFFGLTSFLSAQDEEIYKRRLVWRGDENIYRYVIEVEKSENRTFQHYLREFTTSSFLILSFQAGEYRFRVTPHDILDRPGTPTRWVNFTVLPAARQSASGRNASDASNEQIDVINIEQITKDGEQSTVNNEQLTEGNDTRNAARYNSIGISIGTAFADPLLTAAVHGTYSPLNYFFIGAGFDAGLLSMFDSVDNFYSLYPYINAGFFLPVGNRFGIYAGAGGGYLFGSYQFSHGGKSALGFFAADITAGVNIINAVNIYYTLKTNFNAVSHKIAVGYVYRF